VRLTVGRGEELLAEYAELSKIFVVHSWSRGSDLSFYDHWVLRSFKS